MNVALCCIGRLENQYAEEFVKYYKDLGFNKIFIYDNNHDGEEYFEDVLSEYVKTNFVEIINFRNIENAQLIAYNDCYNKHGDEYDWIAFFDFDEFLTLIENDDISSYLSSFENVDVVKVNWMVFTDNNIIINDKKPVLDRFITPMEYKKCVNYNFPENFHVKSIIRGGIKNFNWVGNPHVPGMELNYVDTTGNKSDSSPFQEYNYTKAFLKHFTTKTIDEFYNKKRIRGQADRHYQTFINFFDINDFFKINRRTYEKECYINDAINKARLN